MLNKLLTATAIVVATSTMVLAENLKPWECKLPDGTILNHKCPNDDNYLSIGDDSFINGPTETSLDYPGNSDTHRQDIGRAQRTGNNGRGTTTALDSGNPPGGGKTQNDPN